MTKVAYIGTVMSGVCTSVRFLFRDSVAPSFYVFDNVWRNIPSPIEAEYGKKMNAGDILIAASSLMRRSNSTPTLATLSEPSIWRATRPLAECDALIFVIDSQQARVGHCQIDFQDVKVWLEILERKTIPIVFQCNKRDLPSACAMTEIEGLFSWVRCAFVPSVAPSGFGITEGLHAALRMIDSGK